MPLPLTPDDLAFDREHLWHPYTSMVNPSPTFPVVGAQGVLLELADGRQLIDGMASWWAAIHGYNHPQLNQAITDQLQSMSHVMFGGLTHQPAIELGKKLVAITPTGLEKVFLSDSGSIAVEVALKIALQYQHALGKTDKKKLLTVKQGYHGDTFATMALCDPDNGMHQLFKHMLSDHYFAPAPNCDFHQPFSKDSTAELQTLIEQHHSQIAALILEPVVQGAGGMRFYHPDYLKACRRFCDEYGLLLIYDEIATGFGRSGKLFTTEWAEEEALPDILCVGKALTGGYMTLAATLCTEQVATTLSQQGEGVLMHGPTFMGNPLACAVANASIELLLESPWQHQVNSIEQQLKQRLLPLASLKAVADSRVLGAIGVVELHKAVDMHKIQPLLVDLGVWIRPFGKLLYIMPPFIINSQQLDKLCDAIEYCCQQTNIY